LAEEVPQEKSGVPFAGAWLFFLYSTETACGGIGRHLQSRDSIFKLQDKRKQTEVQVLA
jgi:hypothetical protein